QPKRDAGGLERPIEMLVLRVYDQGPRVGVHRAKAVLPQLVGEIEELRLEQVQMPPAGRGLHLDVIEEEVGVARQLEEEAHLHFAAGGNGGLGHVDRYALSGWRRRKQRIDHLSAGAAGSGAAGTARAAVAARTCVVAARAARKHKKTH